MNKAVKIKIAGAVFLLPQSSQRYEFPSYILQHKQQIEQYIEAGKQYINNPLIEIDSDLPDLTEFRKITGIIGFPFDSRDPDLYAIDKKIKIVMEVEI